MCMYDTLCRTGVEQHLDVNTGFKASKHWVDVGVYKGSTGNLLYKRV